MIAWPLCGLVMAGRLLSAGPAFYAHVARGPDPFAELVAFHRAIGSSAAYWQSYLWDVQTSRAMALGAGISAMPSMHLTAATLCACAVWGQGRGWRIAGVAFVAVMLIGSVYTGWHYAVDGYVGIIAALGIWWLSSRLAGA
jgi:membrane-associated phospholipid phosphatase